MRESLYTVLLSSIDGTSVRPGDLARVNEALGESIGHRVLAPAERGGVREEWRASDKLEQVLWPVAIDAWDLLTEPELVDVKQCPVDHGGCGWLFLDESRSRNRRWCDMRTCGNRAKVRAHYSRKTE
jgi:predicted RNA-binding Zn ribbon-like protein